MYERFTGILEVFQSNQKLMGYFFRKILQIGRNTYTTVNSHGTFIQSVLGKALIPGGKEKDKARQIPFGDNPEEEEPHDDFTVPQKTSYGTTWKYDQNAV